MLKIKKKKKNKATTNEGNSTPIPSIALVGNHLQLSMSVTTYCK